MEVATTLPSGDDFNERVLSSVANDSYPTGFPPYDADFFARLLALQQLFMRFKWYLTVIVNPVIGVMGLVGNIISGIVITHSGLDKPSNILLLALAVADSCCLLGAVNIADIIRYFPKALSFGNFYWEFSRESAYICYVISVIFFQMNVFGVYASAALCVLISLERLLAVYFPLHFTTIVTPTRAWFACGGAFLFWVPYTCYMGLTLFQFVYKSVDTWPVIAGTRLSDPPDALVFIDLYCASVLGKFLPLAIVTLGSLLIAIKVRITIRQRQKMVSASANTKSSSSRTTVTLLMVCVVFSVTKYITLATYAINVNDLMELYNGAILGMFIYTLDYINSSCNFIIYVIFNNKFRALFKDLFLPCRSN